MSTKEDTKTNEPKADESKINEETGLPEGLDPGESYMDKSPEEKSEPIPLPHGSRLVGLPQSEADVLLAQEKVAAAEAAVEAEKENPTTADAQLAAAQAELSEAEKAHATAKKDEETTSTTAKTTTSKN